MAEVTNDLIYEALKQMPGNLSQTKGDMRDLKVRMTSVEECLVGINRRLERVGDRMDRLERHVGIVDHSPT